MVEYELKSYSILAYITSITLFVLFEFIIFKFAISVATNRNKWVREIKSLKI